jgi:hypothetical protein
LPSLLSSLTFGLTGSCQPQNQYNDCGVYKGVIEVYGRNLGDSDGAPVTLSTALQAVDSSLIMASQIGAVRIQSSRDLSGERVIPPNEPEPRGSRFSMASIVGLTASVVALVIGVTALLILLRMDAYSKRVATYPYKPPPKTHYLNHQVRDRWSRMFTNECGSTIVGDESTLSRGRTGWDGQIPYLDDKNNDRRPHPATRYDSDDSFEHDDMLRREAYHLSLPPHIGFSREKKVKFYSDDVCIGRNII